MSYLSSGRSLATGERFILHGRRGVVDDLIIHGTDNTAVMVNLAMGGRGDLQGGSWGYQSIVR
jgi:hypothetical protein